MRDYQKILDSKMLENDAEAETIGEYLIKLLATLWGKGEAFSGKRPFGNSAWEYELYSALVKGGHVQGKISDDDYLEALNKKEADKLVFELISSLYKKAS